MSASASCGHYGLVAFSGFDGSRKMDVPRQQLLDAVDGVIRDAGQDVR